ncbi:hypothetical protein [Microvirga arabica]|uniref:hypothetical protein n=1 Tax=Microvirga arabica TaxID=1128671 RepID=UPI001939CB76|nr:hypothetical protein [Microvirga arabica]MBM1175489.1 hypothetical protein [Microvirga arabica]
MTKLPTSTAIAVGAVPCPDKAELDSISGTTELASRNQLFAAVALIGFANGISGKFVGAVLSSGITAAVLSTFQISIIVWAAFAICIRLLLQAPTQAAQPSDWIVASGALMAFLVPVVEMSWVIISGLAIYLLVTSQGSNLLTRGAWILLAVTFPMFWSRLLFYMMSNPILEGDAVLVGWLVGTERVGNAIELADGSGYLWIAPGCSSLANVSLAILCWVTLAKARDRPSSLRDLGWVLAACAAVVGVNVARMSLIGIYPWHYELVHGPVGGAIASWLILGVTVGICFLGVRYDHRTTRI